jgi:hypothetical protein
MLSTVSNMWALLPGRVSKWKARSANSRPGHEIKGGAPGPFRVLPLACSAERRERCTVIAAYPGGGALAE